MEAPDLEETTTMARRTNRNSDTRDDWRTLISPLAANAQDFPHLEAPRVRLTEISEEVGELFLQQSALSASKQEVSQRMQLLMTEGRQLAAFLRAGVKQRYGSRSEKLSAFNIQPFRGRKTANPEEAAKKKLPAGSPAPGLPPETAE
jgi:hypothetical protein